MPGQSPTTEHDQAVTDALNRERDALLRLQRMRFVVAVCAAGFAGFAVGSFTTYQIACALRPGRR